jgi:hypothetical protein
MWPYRQAAAAITAEVKAEFDGFYIQRDELSAHPSGLQEIPKIFRGAAGSRTTELAQALRGCREGLDHGYNFLQKAAPEEDSFGLSKIFTVERPADTKTSR